MKNPYQTFWQFVKGEWTCPKCKITWESMGGLFNDCIMRSFQGKKILEERVECPKCGVIKQLK